MTEQKTYYEVCTKGWSPVQIEAWKRFNTAANTIREERGIPLNIDFEGTYLAGVIAASVLPDRPMTEIVDLGEWLHNTLVETLELWWAGQPGEGENDEVGHA